MTSDITIVNEDSGVTFLVRVEWRHYVGDEDGYDYYDWSLVGFQVQAISACGQDFEFDVDELHGWRFSPEFSDMYGDEIYEELKLLRQKEGDYVD
jgi:hypothetical protein